MILTSLNVLEWVIIGLAIALLIGYTIHAVYRKKHPKQKKEDDDE